jgi:hypothetical protein
MTNDDRQTLFLLTELLDHIQSRMELKLSDTQTILLTLAVQSLKDLEWKLRKAAH